MSFTGSSTTLGDGGTFEGGSGPLDSGSHRDGKGKDAKADAPMGSIVAIGSPCTTTDVCASSGTCTALGSAGMYCTEPCPLTSCPHGTYCSLIGGAATCVPDLMQECLICTLATDCKLPSDACLKAPQGDTFCARDCTPDNQCPMGYTCVDKATYSGAAVDGGVFEGGAGPADGGVHDAGGGHDAGAGGSGDGGGSDATSGADAAMADGGSPSRWCVPSGGASCSCDPSREGEVEACSIINAFGTCTGTQTCNGAAGIWQCNALTPMAEICNGKDDNCNGQVDEGDPNMLCAAEGAPPVHAGWVCMNGMCLLGACDQGWTDFPPGPPADGCPCATDTADLDGLCDQAIPAGSVTDVGGAPLTLTGTLSSATAVQVYSFTTTDTNEMTTNSYHVSIAFTAPTPNNEFVMDVERSAACNDTPTGGSTNITSYDWCVNATSATAGEAPCGPAIVNVSNCADHSSAYFVRVYRKAGATPTCTSYAIAVTGGGGTCDLTAKCM